MFSFYCAVQLWITRQNCGKVIDFFLAVSCSHKYIDEYIFSLKSQIISRNFF